jgi:hypothetical protein
MADGKSKDAKVKTLSGGKMLPDFSQVESGTGFVERRDMVEIRNFNALARKLNRGEGYACDADDAKSAVPSIFPQKHKERLHLQELHLQSLLRCFFQGAVVQPHDSHHISNLVALTGCHRWAMIRMICLCSAWHQSAELVAGAFAKRAASC